MIVIAKRLERVLANLLQLTRVETGLDRTDTRVGSNASDQSHNLRVHVASLRRKLEADPAQPQWLVTEAGVRYRLRDSTP